MKKKKLLSFLPLLLGFSTLKPIVVKEEQNVQEVVDKLEVSTPKRLSSAVDKAIGTILKGIVTGGASLAADILTDYAKDLVVNFLNDYAGIDLGAEEDYTEQFEEIKGELAEIKQIVSSMAAKQDTNQAALIMNPVFKKIQKVEEEFFPMINAFTSFANDEESSDYNAQRLDEEKYQYYKETLENYNAADSNSIVNYVTNLAKDILTPNPSNPSLDIFYYYDLTIGSEDKWSTLYVKHLSEFIAYLSTILSSASTVAKFDTFYRIKDKSVATQNTYKEYIKTMANAINAVNKKLASKVEELYKYDDTYQNDGFIIYRPTNKMYASRVATLTFDSNGTSRRALIQDIDESTHNFQSFGGNYYDCYYAYDADHTFIENVQKDYLSYVDYYKKTDFTIIDYLQEIGFYANNDALFRRAAGLYYGDFEIEQTGITYIGQLHDFNTYTTIINNRGETEKITVTKVATYHYWSGDIKESTLSRVNTDYFICFAVPKDPDEADDIDEIYLDGTYKRINKNSTLDSVANPFDGIWDDFCAYTTDTKTNIEFNLRKW